MRRTVGTLLLGVVFAIPFGIVVNLFVHAGPPGTPVWKTIVGSVVPLLLGLFAAAVWRGYMPTLRDTIRDGSARHEDWLFEHPRHMVGLYVSAGVVLGLMISMPNPDPASRLVAMTLWGSFWGFGAWRRIRRYQHFLAAETG